MNSIQLQMEVVGIMILLSNAMDYLNVKKMDIFRSIN